MLGSQHLELLNNSIKKILVIAKQHQVECEIFASTNIGGSVNVRMQNIDSLEFNNHNKIMITVYCNQQKATVNTTELNEQGLTEAFNKALSIAKFANKDCYAGLADPQLMAQNIIDLDLYHPVNIKPEFAINLAKQCEAVALQHNNYIKNSDGAVFGYNSGFIAVGNSQGFIASYPTTSYSLSCSPIAEKSGNMQRDYEFTVARKLDNLLDLEYIGKKAAQKAADRLGAKKIPTCNCKVLFTPQTAKQLFNYLVTALSGSQIANQSSFLLNKLDTKILPNFINIIDHPLLKQGLNSCCFDSDGVATKIQEITTAGKLNSYLLDHYFAKKLNLPTTGHADGIYNLFIQNSKYSNYKFPTDSINTIDNLEKLYPKININLINNQFAECEDLIKIMQNGLIVTETIGHGVNLVTGDYSKGACGFWVENGKVLYPVEEITIAGNLTTMFNNIIATGQDLNYQNNIITGSVLIDDLTIAGI